MSHDAAVHVIAPVQVPAALHWRLQWLPLQAIPCVHEPAPVHVMSQALAPRQSIVDVHEPPPVQVTEQGMPAGQTMGPVHVPAAVQVTEHVPAGSQVPTPASAQIEGHTAAASIEGASAASLPSGGTLASASALPASIDAPRSVPASSIGFGIPLSMPKIVLHAAAPTNASARMAMPTPDARLVMRPPISPRAP